MNEAAGREQAFRRGATHGSTWLKTIAGLMANDGDSGEKIASRLADLSDTLEDWREAKTANDRPPWEWGTEELNRHIDENRQYW